VKAVIAVIAVVLAIPAGALADPNPAPPNARGTDVAARTSGTRSPGRGI
jgi:hypothetical protein